MKEHDMRKSSNPDKSINISGLGNIVPEGYTYNKKRIEPGSQLNISSASFKWYNLYPGESFITAGQVEESKKYIENEVESGKLKFENEIGFVILHRAGEYLLLLITTWRNTNEMWESVYYKKAADNEAYRQIKFKTDHKGTYCVWELGIVWHERNAWVKFINSQRDSESKLNYMNDLFSGEV
jgi:hypothetical protein